MKEKNVHEGCIEQEYRLFKDILFTDKVKTDENGLIRIDDLEMRSDVQTEVMKIWRIIGTENIEALSDINGYLSEFRRPFGFDVEGVNYEEDVDPIVDIPSMSKLV